AALCAVAIHLQCVQQLRLRLGVAALTTDAYAEPAGEVERDRMSRPEYPAGDRQLDIDELFVLDEMTGTVVRLRHASKRRQRLRVAVTVARCVAARDKFVARSHRLVVAEQALGRADAGQRQQRLRIVLAEKPALAVVG